MRIADRPAVNLVPAGHLAQQELSLIDAQPPMAGEWES
jgi:hypothetical protein